MSFSDKLGSKKIPMILNPKIKQKQIYDESIIVFVEYN